MDLNTSVVVILALTWISILGVAVIIIRTKNTPEKKLPINDRRLRKYACRSCGHGYGSHVDIDNDPVVCSSNSGVIGNLSAANCSCRCFIGKPPRTVTIADDTETMVKAHGSTCVSAEK